MNPIQSTILERDWQNLVIQAARLNGWRIHHTRPALTRSGKWATPIQGHAGFPDLILARAGHVLAWELKREQGRATKDQTVWLDVLGAANGIDARIVRPSEWALVEHVLTRGRE